MAGRSKEVRTMVVVGTFPGEDGGSLRCWAAAHVTAFAMALPGASPKEPTAAKAVAVAPPAAQPAGAKGAKRKGKMALKKVDKVQAPSQDDLSRGQQAIETTGSDVLDIILQKITAECPEAVVHVDEKEAGRARVLLLKTSEGVVLRKVEAVCAGKARVAKGAVGEEDSDSRVQQLLSRSLLTAMLQDGWVDTGAELDSFCSHSLLVQARGLDLGYRGETRESGQVKMEMQVEPDHARVSFSAGWVRIVPLLPDNVAKAARAVRAFEAGQVVDISEVEDGEEALRQASICFFLRGRQITRVLAMCTKEATLRARLQDMFAEQGVDDVVLEPCTLEQDYVCRQLSACGNPDWDPSREVFCAVRDQGGVGIVPSSNLLASTATLRFKDAKKVVREFTASANKAMRQDEGQPLFDEGQPLFVAWPGGMADAELCGEADLKQKEMAKRKVERTKDLARAAEAKVTKRKVERAKELARATEAKEEAENAAEQSDSSSESEEESEDKATPAKSASTATGAAGGSAEKAAAAEQAATPLKSIMFAKRGGNKGGSAEKAAAAEHAATPLKSIMFAKRGGSAEKAAAAAQVATYLKSVMFAKLPAVALPPSQARPSKPSKPAAKASSAKRAVETPSSSDKDSGKDSDKESDKDSDGSDDFEKPVKKPSAPTFVQRPAAPPAGSGSRVKSSTTFGGGSGAKASISFGGGAAKPSGISFGSGKLASANANAGLKIKAPPAKKAKAGDAEGGADGGKPKAPREKKEAAPAVSKEKTRLCTRPAAGKEAAPAVSKEKMKEMLAAGVAKITVPELKAFLAANKLAVGGKK
ncbi:hypothetical protein T484DRAFT_1876141, partial [Baffinella frigidus]